MILIQRQLISKLHYVMPDVVRVVDAYLYVYIIVKTFNIACLADLLHYTV